MRILLVVTVFFAGILFAYSSVNAAEEKVKPRKIQVDSNLDGKVDRIEIYDRDGQILRVEADTTNDGKTDEWIYYSVGKPSKSEKDTNADGKPDVWMEY